VVLLPSRHRLAKLRTAAAEPSPAAELRTAAAEPTAALEPKPELQSAPQAIPVALCGCSPVIHPGSGAVAAAGSGSHLAKSATSP
jgi:hypothetical protein